MKNIVTGGAGFIGSHLIDKLMKSGQEVICIDNLISGDKKNIEKWIDNPRFEFIDHDITEPIDIKTNKIWHFACPASTKKYQIDPISTANINFSGTLNMLRLAKRQNAKILFASTSEIYGESSHEQKETDYGSPNPIGIRSCYAEGKRIAETLCMDFFRCHNTEIKIARIFNTYGPRMKSDDGRLISNFITQAISKKPLTIFGSGKQKRSFCYISDLIEGLERLMQSNYNLPVNFGNPNENYSILQIAELINKKLNLNKEIKFSALPIDDPINRKPSIKLAKKLFNWEPHTNISIGLDLTINHFKKRKR